MAPMSLMSGADRSPVCAKDSPEEGSDRSDAVIDGAVGAGHS